MAIRIIEEQETLQGWVYRMEAGSGEAMREVRVLLSFVDHDHLSGGRVPPHQVASAVLEAVAERRGIEAIPKSFDVSTARRWIEDLTELVHARIGGGFIG